MRIITIMCSFIYLFFLLPYRASLKFTLCKVSSLYNNCYYYYYYYYYYYQFELLFLNSFLFFY